jgi:hypothetical protein
MMTSPLPDTIGSQFSCALGFWDTNTIVRHDDVTATSQHRFSSFRVLATKKFTIARAFFIPVSGKSNLIFA